MPHELVNHSKGEIVNSKGYTTNHIEGRWSAAKRWLKKKHGGRMPTHNDRRKWTRLFDEFSYRKIACNDYSTDGGNTFQVPLREFLKVLAAHRS